MSSTVYDLFTSYRGIDDEVHSHEDTPGSALKLLQRMISRAPENLPGRAGPASKSRNEKWLIGNTFKQTKNDLNLTYWASGFKKRVKTKKKLPNHSYSITIVILNMYSPKKRNSVFS